MMILLAVSLALQSVAEPEPPASLDRIRALLTAPATLQIALPEPAVEFHIFIREHPYWIDEPPAPFNAPPMTPLAAPAAPGSPEWFASQSAGGAGVDPGSLFAHIRHAIQERNARKEVQRAIDEFCAANPCR